MLEVKDLSIQFQKTILDHISFKVFDSSIMVIDGKSGSGKSSLLKFIVNQIECQSGILVYNGEKINDKNREDFLFQHISYIDQAGSYFPNMSIAQHFSFYCQLYKLKEYETRMQENLELVDLSHIDVNRSPSSLSTGERKRFLIALALVEDKDIIILDEPTSSLDDYHKKMILDLLKKLALQDKKTIIMASHDQDVLDISSQIYTIHNHQLSEIKSCHIESHSTKPLKQMGKVKYYRFKNKKLKFMTLMIIVLTSISVSLISQIGATYISLGQVNIKQIEHNQNDLIYFRKKIDPRYILNSANNTEYSYYEQGLDILTDEDINAIKKVEGVKSVLPNIELIGWNSTSFTVYKSDKEVKQVIPHYHNEYETNIVIIGYYSQENIKKSGTNITGIYIDENLNQMLDMNDFSNVDIKVNVALPLFLEKVQKESSESKLPAMISHQAMKNIKISLNDAGVLSDLDYHNERYSTFGRIYMPAEQLQEIISSMNKNDSSQGLYYEDSQKLAYQARQFQIICEEGKEEQIKLEIEKINQLYMADNIKLTNQNYIQYLKDQFTSTSLLSIVILCILMIVTMSLIIYEQTLRKAEIKLMKRMGIHKKIVHYYRQDNQFFIVAGIVSVLFLVMYHWIYLSGLRDYFSLPLFIGVWLLITLSIISIIFLIRDRVILLYVRKV